MSVYYIHAPDLGLVKIGQTEDPPKRLHQLQCSSPTRLVLLAIEEGAAELEQQRHGQFANLRRRGEWFAFERALEAHVLTLAPYVHRRRRKPLPGALGKWLHEHDISLDEFAALIGASAATVSRICSGKIAASKYIEGVYIATRGEIDANALFGLSPDLLVKVPDETPERLSA